jgi:hypothetical protein
LEDIRSNRTVMAYTASAMYGAAALDGAIEGFLPGDPKFALLPVVVVLVMFVALLAVGPRLPRWALALLGPIGVALIAYALATSPGPGDGAILYALPVLWTTIFFGLGGAIAIVACVAIGEAIALLLLPAGRTRERRNYRDGRADRSRVDAGSGRPGAVHRQARRSQRRAPPLRAT